MVKAGQTAGQEQDGAGQTPVRFKNPVRAADEHAVLVSERSAVWDRRSPALPPIVEETVAVGAFGPMPTDWTDDLVHCRLVHIDALMRRLPRPRVPATYRSLLGTMQPEDAGPVRRALTREESLRLDWTWARVCAWPDIDRDIVMGLMAGKALRLVAKVTQKRAAMFGGKGVGKDTVRTRYRDIRRTMAAEWISLGEPVDHPTRECWLDLTSKR